LKYYRDISLGVYLAIPLIEYLDGLAWSFDLVLPVPLGVARLRERGYNQAALLARPIALGTGRAYQPRGLIKVRETPSQVGLTFDQRQQNVKGAFEAVTAAVAGRRILVIDDVATSNSTLEACAEALTKANARQVYGLTLARAGFNPSEITSPANP
jgi:predicted amidophosphoribosyltransferase